MYIEYAVIDGILHVRHDPHKNFVPMSAQQITNYAKEMERELAALKERTRWIPFDEQRPPENETLYTARVFNGKSYWAWLPPIPPKSA